MGGLGNGLLNLPPLNRKGDMTSYSQVWSSDGIIQRFQELVPEHCPLGFVPVKEFRREMNR